MKSIDETNDSGQIFLPGQTPEEKILFLLEFAILAPSTHNSQPWRFKVKEKSCVICGDPSLEIPFADKEKRDFYISLGACIENLFTAANYFQVFDRLEYRLRPGSYEVAELFFKDLHRKTGVEQEYKNLFYALKSRVNVRGIFEKRSVNVSELSEVVREQCGEEGVEVFVTDNAEKINRLGELTGEGLRIAYKNPLFRKEMSQWINNSLTRKKQGLPGYALKIPLLLSFVIPVVVKHFNIGNKLAILNHKSIKSAPVVVIFTSSQNAPLQFVKTGRVAERLILWLEAKKISSSIFVAAIEMGKLYETVQREFGLKNRPQFLICAGFMNSDQKPTPRHPVKNKLISESG